MGMSIQVNDFRWEPGKNDGEYIKLLESSRDEWQKIAQKAIAKLRTLSKVQEPTSTPEAEWLLYKGRRGATCSFCKHTYNDVYDVENYDYYCRHCGAKMVRIRTVKWK